MSKQYIELTLLIERLHRRFLHVFRTELKGIGVRDINGVQALILTNIGEDEVVIRDLIERGYYQGSNISYNIKKLTDYGYLAQERAQCRGICVARGIKREDRHGRRWGIFDFRILNFDCRSREQPSFTGRLTKGWLPVPR